MKREQLVTAPHGGKVTKIAAGAGVTLMQDEAILFLEPAEIDAHDIEEEEHVDLDHIRPDLAELIARHAITLDENRPASVERRRKTNQRTARENVAHLVDTDRLGMTGLDGPSFVQFAKLSGLVPVIGVVSGYCFAGNAAMLGCCDVIIATKNASIGMGGPAMIEGGGLGVYHPAEVGPVSFQSPNGVIDTLSSYNKEPTTPPQKHL